MVVSVLDLPDELLTEHIFHDATSSELRQYMLVCKAWKQYAGTCLPIPDPRPVRGCAAPTIPQR